RSHGDAAPLRHHRIAAGPVRAGALRQWPEGPDGRRDPARWMGRGALVALNPMLVHWPVRFVASAGRLALLLAVLVLAACSGETRLIVRTASGDYPFTV